MKAGALTHLTMLCSCFWLLNCIAVQDEDLRTFDGDDDTETATPETHTGTIPPSSSATPSDATEAPGPTPTQGPDVSPTQWSGPTPTQGPGPGTWTPDTTPTLVPDTSPTDLPWNTATPSSAVDHDGDGYSTAASGGTDCNDEAAQIHPGATETCNNLDDDCDGQVDEGLPDQTWYPDLDKDGFGDSTGASISCAAPSGYVSQGGDCRDTNDAVYPGAIEFCDSLDDDCDGLVDEGLGTTYYRDGDKDGFGDASSTTTSCLGAPNGYVEDNTDCDDGNASVNPDAPELDNGIDDDCDGFVDFVSSCLALQTAEPDAPSGVYTLNPGGGSAFQAYCEMELQGGGWTLLAVVTIADGPGATNWSPRSSYWVDQTAFGAYTSPSTNADAKSPAYWRLTGKSLMIVAGMDDAEIVTDDACLGNKSLYTIMRRDSSYNTTCAWFCNTTHTSNLWKTDNCLSNNELHFRCMDGDGWDYQHGYWISTSDNSFITTLDNDSSCRNYSFGIGVSDYRESSSDQADFSPEYGDPPFADDDTVQRLIYIR